MMKLSAIILTIGLAALSAQAVKTREGFRFLGSVKKEVTTATFGISSFSVQEKEYWMSVNAAQYPQAAEDCQAYGDALLQIETKEELDIIEKWLEDDPSTATSGWVGAKFVTKLNKFTWENGEEIHSSLWYPNEPNLLKANSRIIADIYGDFVELKTQASSKAARYICEGN